MLSWVLASCQTPVAETESCASKGKCGGWEKKGGIFFLHMAFGVQWHQSLSSSMEFTAGMYESDQPLMRGQWKRLPQDHMKTHVQSPDTIKQQNDILHNLPWRQWTKESLNLSVRVDWGWWDVSKPPLLFHHKLFPVGLTQSRMDLFSEPVVAQLDPWLPSSFSLAPLPLLPISFCVFCFKLLFCFALFCLCFLFGFFCNSSFSLSSSSLTACEKRSHDLMHDSGHAGLKWLKVWHD